MGDSSISDTARWVAHYRAVESERPDALFRDPFAKELAGKEGERISKLLDRRDLHSWVLTVRTVVMDQWIMDLVTHQRVDAVINLACGLDTRPYRLKLPKQLTWVEIDLPGIITHKEKVLKEKVPNCRLERIAIDLLDIKARKALFKMLNSKYGRVVILTEGLLVYLEEKDVKILAKELAEFDHFLWWIMDIFSPFLIRLAAFRTQMKLVQLNTSFKFAPKIGSLFFLPFHWKEKESRSLLEEGVKLKRLPLGISNFPGISKVIGSSIFRIYAANILKFALLERT